MGNHNLNQMNVCVCVSIQTSSDVHFSNNILISWLCRE